MPTSHGAPGFATPFGEGGIDPEQRVLAPIFVSPEKVIFEFQRADVLFVRADGTLSELTDIFPAPARRPTHARRQVPRGEARLTFHEDGED